jgi:hypothetical protein
VLQQRQRYWERLFLSTIDMSEADLRATLQTRNPARRFAAAYVVGEKFLAWHTDLIPLLEDKSDAVRQAARRSLVILSFLALNPQEAQRIRSRQHTDPPTPLAQLQSPVDFGPAPGAGPAARSRAVKEWTQWWAGREARLVTNYNPTEGYAGESQRLAGALLRADPRQRPQIVARYRDTKGAQYSEALALAIARLSGDDRQPLREALAGRMARMTNQTLGEYLQDEDAELRRAAALGLALRKSTAHFGRVIGLLLDSEPAVERAAHSALVSLSGEDFGPRVNASEEEKIQASAQWRKWWDDRPGSR